MVTVLSGVALLVATLAVFSLFSLKMPKGSLAMSGMADAAVATFLVEAIHSYISGDLFGISFLKQVGTTSGSMGGVAAAIMVPICMGANPLYGVVAGVAVDATDIVYKYRVRQKCLSDEFCTERIARHQDRLCEISLFCCYMWCWNVAHFILLSSPELPKIHV